MLISSIGFTVLLIAIYLTIYSEVKYLIYFLFLVSTFTAVSMINFPASRNSLMLFQIVGILFILKVAINLFKGIYKFNFKVSKLLLGFIIICLISTIYPLLFSKGVIVLTTDDKMEPLKFGIHNITQVFYLVFSYLIYIGTLLFFHNEELNKSEWTNVFRITCLTILCFGIIQFIIPYNIYDSFFRTNYNHNIQFVFNKVRISSLNDEPSVLSLFIAPASIFLFETYLLNKKKIDLLLLILTVIICVENSSSSFFIIILIYLLIKISLNFKLLRNTIFRKFKDSFIGRKNQLKIVAAILLIVFLLVVFKAQIIRVFSEIVNKISGHTDSGTIRKDTFTHHIKLFFQYPITGIGFGSVRSKDLFSTWLSEIGLLGFVLYFLYVINLCRNIFMKINSFYYKILLCIISINFIMMTSVPEPYYLYYWIWLAMAEFMVKKNVKRIEV